MTEDITSDHKEEMLKFRFRYMCQAKIWLIHRLHLDISSLLDMSEGEFIHTHKHQSSSFDKCQKERSTPEAGYSGVSQDTVSQAEVIKQILEQLSDLGDRLSSIENSSASVGKGDVGEKTSDRSKIKSTKKSKAGKLHEPQYTSVDQSGSHPQFVGLAIHNTEIPTPNVLQEEARIQQEVERRLKQLQESAKPGTDKICSQKKVKWPHQSPQSSPTQ